MSKKIVLATAFVSLTLALVAAAVVLLPQDQSFRMQLCTRLCSTETCTDPEVMACIQQCVQGRAR